MFSEAQPALVAVDCFGLPLRSWRPGVLQCLKCLGGALLVLEFVVGGGWWLLLLLLLLVLVVVVVVVVFRLM